MICIDDAINISNIIDHLSIMRRDVRLDALQDIVSQWCTRCGNYRAGVPIPSPSDGGNVDDDWCACVTSAAP